MEIKDRNVIEMNNGDLLLYVEDMDLYVGLNNDSYITDSYLVESNVAKVYADYTLKTIIYSQQM